MSSLLFITTINRYQRNVDCYLTYNFIVIRVVVVVVVVAVVVVMS